MDDAATGNAPERVRPARITHYGTASVITFSQRQLTLTEFICTAAGAGLLLGTGKNQGLSDLAEVCLWPQTELKEHADCFRCYPKSRLRGI